MTYREEKVTRSVGCGSIPVRAAANLEYEAALPGSCCCCWTIKPFLFSCTSVIMKYDAVKADRSPPLPASINSMGGNEKKKRKKKQSP